MDVARLLNPLYQPLQHTTCWYVFVRSEELKCVQMYSELNNIMPHSKLQLYILSSHWQ